MSAAPENFDDVYNNPCQSDFKNWQKERIKSDVFAAGLIILKMALNIKQLFLVRDEKTWCNGLRMRFNINGKPFTFNLY